ncbi:hypothetical protein YC2023_111278 [Brassica napus]
MRIRRNRIEQLIESLLDLRSKINREQNQTKEEMILKSEKEIIRSRLKVIERENENQKGYRSKGNRKKAITLPRGVVLKEEKMFWDARLFLRPFVDGIFQEDAS